MSKMSHAELCQSYLPRGTRQGVVQVNFTSKGRPVFWLALGKRGHIVLQGRIGREGWLQSYKNYAPVDEAG